MEKIAVAAINHKGGVGKTTLSIILTQMALLKRQKVLAIDLDPQRNFTDALSFIADYFKGTLRVKATLEPEDAECEEDWIILDCPPVLGDITREAVDFADIALAPVRPDFFSLSNLGVLYSFVEETGKDRNQIPVVKVGYDTSRLARMVEQILVEKQYPVAGRVPLNRLIPYNITLGRIWSTGLTADARRPFEQMYSRIVGAYERMLAGDFTTSWGD
ncbi:MAG: ParA family protein [Fretibacterium sp.]|nr:ParA family protein [Fretibacterium sp.]